MTLQDKTKDEMIGAGFCEQEVSWWDLSRGGTLTLKELQ